MSRPTQQNAPAMEKLIKRHPFQRLESPSRSLSAIFHVVGLTSFTMSFKFLADNPNHINTAYGWHFQYLTIIGLSLATLTFIAGLLSDLTLSPFLFRAKTTLSISSAPLNLLISLLYWSIRLIDSTLIVPPDLELPLSADLGFHAAPAAFLLLDLLFLSPPWSVKAVPALALSTFIAFAYWFWIELCYSHNGFYPYPLFAILDTKQRVGLFGGSAVVMALGTVALGSVYGWVNGVEGLVGREKGRKRL